MNNKVIGYVLSFLVISMFRMIIVLYYQMVLWYPVKEFWKVKEYVRYSANLLPVELAYWIINTSDRLVITALIDVYKRQKLHPGEYETWRKNYPWLEKNKKIRIIDSLEHNIYECFAMSDYQVGVSSTAIYLSLIHI